MTHPFLSFPNSSLRLSQVQPMQHQCSPPTCVVYPDGHRHARWSGAGARWPRLVLGHPPMTARWGWTSLDVRNTVKEIKENYEWSFWEWSELALAQPNLTSVSTIVCTCTTTIFTRKTENEDCKRRHPFWHSTRTVYMYNVYVQCIYHVHLCTYRYVHGTCTGTCKVWHVHVLYIHVHVHTMHMKCSCSPNKMSTFTNQEGSSSVPNFVYLYLLSWDQTAGRHLVLHDVHVLHKRMGFWMLHFVYWKPVLPLPSYVTSHRSE